MTIVIHGGKKYDDKDEYCMDNCAIAPTGWAMYATGFLVGQDEGEVAKTINLRCIPTKAEALAIDSGKAEVDFIDYDKTEVRP